MLRICFGKVEKGTGSEEDNWTDQILFFFVRIEKQLTQLLRRNWIRENALFVQALINATKPVFTLLYSHTNTHTHTKLILNSHKKHSNTNKYNKCQLSRLIDPFSLNCVCKFRFSPHNCTYSVTLATHYSTPTQCVPYIVHVNLCYHEQHMHVCASKTLNKNVIYA